MKRQLDPLYKNIIRKLYRFLLGLKEIVNILVPKNKEIRLNYAGALAGDVGGPLVKVKRLQEYYPEQKFGYTILYSLSNTPYLSKSILNLIKKRKIPIIHNQNGVFYPAWFDGDWRAENKRMAGAYHLADYVFWQSEFCKRSADQFLGKRNGPGEILFNGVDTRRFCPSEKHSAGGRFRFLVSGKIGRHLAYRVEESIEALSIVHKQGLNAELVVAGWLDEEVLKTSKRLINQLNITDYVVFTGSYSQEQAPEIYRSSNVYLMTKHNDPCPNTVLEAMASGLPVIYSESGGVPELVESSAGIPLNCKESYEEVQRVDVFELAEAMLTASTEYIKMSEAARSRAQETFCIHKWIQRHSEIFNQLMKEI